MGTRMAVALTATLVFLCCGSVVSADPSRLDALEKRLDAQQAIIERQARQIQGMQSASTTTVATRDEVESMVRKYLDVAAEKEGAKSGMLSLRQEWLRIGGELRTQYVNVENDDHYWYDTGVNDTTTGGVSNTFEGVWDVATFGDRGGWGAVVGAGRAISEFQVYKAALDFRAYYTDDVYARVKAEMLQNATTLEQAYFHFGKMLHTLGIDDPFDVWMRFGIFSVLEKIDRETQSYGLVTRVTQREGQEPMQLAFGGDYNVNEDIDVYAWMTLMNGRPIGSDSVNMSNNFQMLQETRGNPNSDFNQNKVLGACLGAKVDMHDAGKLNIRGFMYSGELSEVDLWYLSSIRAYREMANPLNYGRGLQYLPTVPLATLYPDDTFYTDPEYQRYGAYLDYRLNGFRMYALFENFQYSHWRRRGQEYFARYCIDLDGIEFGGRKWWTSVTPFVRWSSMQERGMQADAWDSRTWDRRKTDLGVLVGVTRNVMLRIEWSICEEAIGDLHIPQTVGSSTYRPAPTLGANDPDNDQFLVQLQAKF